MTGKLVVGIWCDGEDGRILSSGPLVSASVLVHHTRSLEMGLPISSILDSCIGLLSGFGLCLLCSSLVIGRVCVCRSLHQRNGFL